MSVTSNKTAIVVLGAAVRKSGNVSNAILRRVNHTHSVFNSRSNYDLIVVSGGLGKYGPTESSIMKEVRCNMGIENSIVIEEDKSTTTFQNAITVRKLLLELGIKKATIVTDCYHMPRAFMTFRLLGVDVNGSCPVGVFKYQGLSFRKVGYCYIREIIAIPAYASYCILQNIFLRE